MTISLADERRLADLGQRLRDARHVTVLTGAGISAASGVPTFRGASGLWRTFRAEDLATPEAFERDPTLVWEWYDWRRSLVAQCRPNAGHEALARLSLRDGTTLITQNVDGLHELALRQAQGRPSCGSAPRDVLRFHGSIWHLRCALDCGAAPASWEDRRVPLPELPPRCPGCGGYARPAVVWFGEAIDSAILNASLAATQCDVYLSVGTSSLVHPAAGLIARAKAHGAYTVEINPDPTPHAQYVDVALGLRAEEALPELGV
jgi:NAD-dependent deacetylase